MRHALTLFAAAVTFVAVPQATAQQAAPASVDESLAAYVAAADPVRLDLARQILAIGMPEERRVEVFMGVADAMMAQMDQAMPSGISDPGLRKVVDDHKIGMVDRMKGILVSHLPNIMEGWAVALASEFSEEELRDVLAFVATPSGQRFFERSSQIAANPAFAAVNQAYMADIFRMIPAEQAELRRKMRDYRASQ